MSLFPQNDKHTAQLTVEGLPVYVQEFNQANIVHNAKLRVWRSTKRTTKTLHSPVTLRYDVLNVLSAYVVVGFAHKEDTLHVESVMMFGPREKVGAYLCLGLVVDVTQPFVICFTRKRHIHHQIIQSSR